MANVSLNNYSLDELFNGSLGNLCIPDYQRTYCWLEKNVYKLLDDIWNITEEYHLGSVIVQNKGGFLNIIDGQQRLITLTLILNELNDSGSLPLLYQKIESNEAIQYIAYNKYLISNYVKKFNLSEKRKIEKVNHIRTSLKFSVLVLEDSSLDLAYTFFSSQNAKGVKLTSYELLKSHHLHFIRDENQAKHMARRWDKVLSDKDSDECIEKTMGSYLFRMRKWIYSKEWNDKAPFKVKEEFESALIIPEIPPFGEQFLFKEPIQGGTHFFAYADYFINRCKDYHRTSAYMNLKGVVGESHQWFRSVAEALLFSYYLKFGESYLSEALWCILKIVSQHRYEKLRIEEVDIVQDYRNGMIMRCIDYATSPTFFLAASRDFINKMEDLDKDKSPIMKRYNRKINNVYSEIKKNFVSETFIGKCND